MDIKYQNPILS